MLFDKCICVYLCNVELGFLGVIVFIWVYILCFCGEFKLVNFFFLLLKFLFKVGEFDFLILFCFGLCINWLIVGMWYVFFFLFFNFIYLGGLFLG